MGKTSQFGAEEREGRFVRQDSTFRERAVEPVAGRYHLYVSLACPWAHRAIVVRRLKGLEDAIGMTVVDPIRDDRGWRFGDEFPDPLHGWDYLSRAYDATDPHWSGRVTVPVLWDTLEERIVNNESADVIELLNGSFDPVAEHADLDLYPDELRAEMDPLMERVYDNVNNGVYKAGFATSQEAYEEAVVPLFETLDELEERLGDARPYLMGDRFTLADIRLFTTLVRFDAVYHGHFKCNVRRIVDYPGLQGLLRRVYHHEGIAETVDFDHIKRHYYVTHDEINPTGIVPVGPALDL